jgi:selenocysteine-specific elongation factor
VAGGDRYIVRQPSPSVTVGGGQVIDAHPRRHKRFHEKTLHTLQTLQRGTPEEIVLEALGSAAMEVKQVIEKSSLDSAQALQALASLIANGRVLQLSGARSSDAAAPISPPSSALVTASSTWEDVMRQAQALLGAHHRQYPLKRGMGKEELRSRLASTLSPKAFPHVMALGVNQGLLAEDPTTYRLPDHRPTFSAQQREQVERLRRAMAEAPYSPPSPQELGVDPEVVAALVEAGELLKLSDSLFYTRQAYDDMRARTLEAIDRQGEVNVAIMRDLFGTTRKYAIPFLEHLDEQKVTRRVGDVRVRW